MVLDQPANGQPRSDNPDVNAGGETAQIPQQRLALLLLEVADERRRDFDGQLRRMGQLCEQRDRASESVFEVVGRGLPAVANQRQRAEPGLRGDVSSRLVEASSLVDRRDDGVNELAIEGLATHIGEHVDERRPVRNRPD